MATCPELFSEIDPALLKRDRVLGCLLIFLDNFGGGEESERRIFESLQEEAPQARWICVGEETIATMARETRPEGFQVAFIQQLPRRAIRELSRRWCAQMGRDGNKAYEAVMSQLQRANLPRTGYMVALLLWAMHRSLERQLLNEAVLLENVLEYLFEKTDFTLALRKEFDYRAKEITLQSLTHFLKQRGDYADINDVLTRIISFFKENGFNYGANDILQQFERPECWNVHLIRFSSNINVFKNILPRGELLKRPISTTSCLKIANLLNITGSSIC